MKDRSLKLIERTRSDAEEFLNEGFRIATSKSGFYDMHSIRGVSSQLTQALASVNRLSALLEIENIEVN